MWNVALWVSIALVFHTQFLALYKSVEIKLLAKVTPTSQNIIKVATRSSFEHYKKMIIQLGH